MISKPSEVGKGGTKVLKVLNLEVTCVSPALILLVRTSHMTPSLLQRKLGNVGETMEYLWRINNLCYSPKTRLSILPMCF